MVHPTAVLVLGGFISLGLLAPAPAAVGASGDKFTRSYAPASSIESSIRDMQDKELEIRRNLTCVQTGFQESTLKLADLIAELSSLQTHQELLLKEKETVRDRAVYEDIIRKVVEFSPAAGLGKLMEALGKVPGKQAYPAFAAIAGRLKSSKADADTYVLRFANLVKTFTDNNHEDFRNLREQLPSSIRTIVFAPRAACFTNELYQGLLHEGDTWFNTFFGIVKDRNRKNVFTSINSVKNPASQSFRLHHKEGANYYILRESSKKADKYLYAETDAYNFRPARRRVFLWGKGCPGPEAESGSIPDAGCSRALWTIEPSGNNIYLKNAYYGEYLVASTDENKENSEDRKSFTMKYKERPAAGEWRVAPCASSSFQ